MYRNKKIGKIIFLISLVSFFWIFWINLTNAFNLKAIQNKFKQEQQNKNKEQWKASEDNQNKNTESDKEDLLKVKNIEIDEKFYELFKNDVSEKLKLYEQYLKEKDEEKKKALEAKYAYLKQLRKQVKEIKAILDKNDFLYMGVIYIPKNSNLIFFKYNEKLYYLPNFSTKVITKEDIKDINKFIDEKYKKLKKIYKIDQINVIKSKKEFDYLNDKFWLIPFNDVKENLNIFLDTNANIITYPIEALKEALKEKWIQYNSKWILVFFILNDFNDPVMYRSQYFQSTVKLISNTFMKVWQNNIWINSFLNNFWYREIFLPLRIIKKQKIIELKEKKISVFDIFIFIWIILWGGVLIYVWLKKLFNIYNDLE